ncbi:Phosphotransferase system, phosphocarrier protein HPr [Chitinispirillum alkaliphilum]|nr:Phosphotransferase system, phosphocarrier protein HPr [Chitinispirillum alkaliphilum]
MIEESVVVENSLGIHARPASMIVQTAMKFKSDIKLVKNGASADAKSIMSVMMLAAACNTTVVITASGEDENEAVKAIRALFEQKFNEE